MRVIFPREDVALHPADSNTAAINVGDYVRVKVNTSALKSVLRAVDKVVGGIMNSANSDISTQPADLSWKVGKRKLSVKAAGTSGVAGACRLLLGEFKCDWLHPLL